MPNGEVWVTDSNNHRIQVISQSGAFLKAIGNGQGAGPAQFAFPTDVAAMPNGEVWVTDCENHRIQVISQSGDFVKAIGHGRGAGRTQFSRPFGVAAMPNGEVWVTDWGNHRIQVMSSGAPQHAAAPARSPGTAGGPTPDALNQQQQVAEIARLSADNARLTFDYQQQAAEVQRIVAENQQQAAEIQRILAENQRQAAENQRILAENQRILAENQRQAAEIQRLASELAAHQSAASAFEPDRPYRLRLAGAGLPSTAAFGPGSLHPAAPTSALWGEARELMRGRGSFWPVPSPVAGFQLEGVDAVGWQDAGFEHRLRRLQLLREGGGTLFNPSAFDAEELQLLIALRDLFLPRQANVSPQHPNLMHVFHGTNVGILPSVLQGLVAVRSTDSGFFGSGVYTTPNIEYAAKYAAGQFSASPIPRRADGCVPVVWCCAAVGVAKPLTPRPDCTRPDGHSTAFGAPLTRGFDAHVAAVSQTNGFRAVPRASMQYMELVFDQEVQVLPIAVLWLRVL
jgi:hypothetical protein